MSIVFNKKINIVLLIMLTISLNLFSQKKSDYLLKKGDHFALCNGIKIHYYVSGRGPVCLVPTPGWGPSINYLKNSLTPLEEKFTIVYYDTRHSGETEGPVDTTKYTSNDFIADMNALRIHLKQKKVWIMGHSMGGFQVLYYGIKYKEYLNGIIALNAMAGEDSLYNTEFKKMVMKRKGKPYFEKGSDIFFGKDTNKYTTTEVMQYILPFYFHDERKIKEFEKLGNPNINDKVYEYTQKARFGTEYLFPLLSKINVPTLIVCGDDDFVCDKISQADRIHKAIKKSELITIKNSGHFSWIEQPKQFFTSISSWIQKHVE